MHKKNRRNKFNVNKTYIGLPYVQNKMLQFDVLRNNYKFNDEFEY